VSIVAALLGIIVGALLKGAVDVWLDERREKKQERAAVRLLREDLSVAHNALVTSLEREEWWPPSWPLSWTAWEAHRELLAGRLAPEDWTRVASGFSIIEIIDRHVAVLTDRHLAAGKAESDPPDFRSRDKQHLERAADLVAVAQEAVEDMLAPGE
jgi:hypothetical protein